MSQSAHRLQHVLWLCTYLTTYTPIIDDAHIHDMYSLWKWKNECPVLCREGTWFCDRVRRWAPRRASAARDPHPQTATSTSTRSTCRCSAHWLFSLLSSVFYKLHNTLFLSVHFIFSTNSRLRPSSVHFYFPHHSLLSSHRLVFFCISKASVKPQH